MLKSFVTLLTISSHSVVGQTMDCDTVKQFYQTVSLADGATGCCAPNSAGTFSTDSCVASKARVDTLATGFHTVNQALNDLQVNVNPPEFVNVTHTAEFLRGVLASKVGTTPDNGPVMWADVAVRRGKTTVYELGGVDPRTRLPWSAQYKDYTPGTFPTKAPIGRMYSSGKILGAVAMAILMDRGLVAPDQGLHRWYAGARVSRTPTQDDARTEQPRTYKIPRPLSALSTPTYDAQGAATNSTLQALQTAWTRETTSSDVTAKFVQDYAGTRMEWFVARDAVFDSARFAQTPLPSTGIFTTAEGTDIVTGGPAISFTFVWLQGGAYGWNDGTSSYNTDAPGHTGASAYQGGNFISHVYATSKGSTVGYIANPTFTLADGTVLVRERDYAHLTPTEFYKTLVPASEWKTAADIQLPDPGVSIGDRNEYWMNYFNANNIPYGLPAGVYPILGNLGGVVPLDATLLPASLQSQADSLRASINARVNDDATAHYTQLADGSLAKVHPFYTPSSTYFYYEEAATRYPTVRDTLHLASGLRMPDRWVTPGKAEEITSCAASDALKAAFPDFTNATAYAPGTTPLGVGNQFNDYENVLVYGGTLTRTKKPIYDAILSSGMLAYPPGTVYKYASDMSVYEGVIEDVYNAHHGTTLSLEEILKVLIFDPLEMTDTFFHTPRDHPRFEDRLDRYVPIAVTGNKIDANITFHPDGSVKSYHPFVYGYVWSEAQAAWIPNPATYELNEDLESNKFPTRATPLHTTEWSTFSSVPDFSKVSQMLAQKGKYFDSAGRSRRLLSERMVSTMLALTGPSEETQAAQLTLGGEPVNTYDGDRTTLAERTWSLGIAADTSYMRDTVAGWTPANAATTPSDPYLPDGVKDGTVGENRWNPFSVSTFYWAGKAGKVWSADTSTGHSYLLQSQDETAATSTSGGYGFTSRTVGQEMRDVHRQLI